MSLAVGNGNIQFMNIFVFHVVYYCCHFMFIFFINLHPSHYFIFIHPSSLKKGVTSSHLTGPSRATLAAEFCNFYTRSIGVEWFVPQMLMLWLITLKTSGRIKVILMFLYVNNPLVYWYTVLYHILLLYFGNVCKQTGRDCRRVHSGLLGMCWRITLSSRCVCVSDGILYWERTVIEGQSLWGSGKVKEKI